MPRARSVAQDGVPVLRGAAVVGEARPVLRLELLEARETRRQAPGPLAAEPVRKALRFRRSELPEPERGARLSPRAGLAPIPDRRGG